MPKLTATRGGVDIPDGTYPATVLSVVDQPPGPKSPKGKPYLRWTFVVDDGSSDGVEMTANSTGEFGVKTKTRAWAEALIGRKIPNGEVFDPDDVLPRDCLVAIARNDEDFAVIEKILTLPKNKPMPPAPALPPPTPAPPEGEDGIPF